MCVDMYNVLTRTTEALRYLKNKPKAKCRLDLSSLCSFDTQQEYTENARIPYPRVTSTRVPWATITYDS